jgi:hypothetical protein
MVESENAPVFGEETEELLALRNLARHVGKYLEDGATVDGLEQAWVRVKRLQKRKKRKH